MHTRVCTHAEGPRLCFSSNGSTRNQLAAASMKKEKERPIVRPLPSMQPGYSLAPCTEECNHADKAIARGEEARAPTRQS